MNNSKKIYLNYLLNKAKQIFKEKNRQFNFCKKTLVFEKQVKETQSLYELCLNQKLKLLQVINNDEINIKSLYKIGTNLLQQRNQLKAQIRNLSMMNKFNPELKEIINGFLISLSFLDTKDNLVNYNYNSSNFSNDSSESIYSIELKNESETTYFKNESIKSYYKTCVVFFSIQQGERGKILATSNNFESIFGFQNIISQDISIIFPSIMIQKFEQRIDNMTNMVNYENKQDKQIKMLLCRTNIGLGIPIIPRMFLDYIPHLDMFGIIIRLEVSNNTNYFALFSPQNFQLNLVNTVFYSEFMKKYFKVQEISTIYFSKLVPISIFLKHSRILKGSPFIDTLCFLPNKQNNQDSFYFKTPLTIQDLLEQKISQNSLYQFDFYKIRFYVKEVENYEDELLLCEIFSLKKIKKQKEIQENIQLLKIQIDSLILEAEQLNFLTTLQSQNSKPSNGRQDETISENRYNNIKWNKTIRKGSRNDEDKYEGSQKDLLSTNYMMQGNRTLQKLLDHEKMQETFHDKKTNYINELLSPSTSNQFSGILLSPTKIYMHDDKTKVFDDDYIQNMYQESYYSSEKYINYQSNQNKNVSNMKYFQHQKSIETEVLNQYQEIQVDMPSIQQIQDNYNNNLIYSNGLVHDQSYFTPNQGMKRFNYPDITPHLIGNEEINTFQNRQQIFFTKKSQFNNQDGSDFSDAWSKQSNSFDTDDSDLDNKRSRRTHVTQKTGSNQQLTYQSLKHIYNSVLKKQRNVGLQILNIFGIASLLLIIGLISVDFVLIIQTFQKAKIDYQFITWPMDLQSLLSQIMYRVYIIGINDQKIIPALVKAWPQYYQENIDFIHQNQAEVIKMYDNQQNGDFQIASYFEKLADTDDTFILKKDFSSYKGMNFTVQTKQQYFILYYIITHYLFSQKIYNAYNPLGTIFDNFDNYNQIITQLQGDIYESSVDSLNQILENTKLLMIICIILALLIICAVIPLNAIIQTQREIVLKLFATMQSQDIQNMENACLNSLQAKERNQTKKRIQSTQTLIGQVSQHDLSYKKIPISSTKISIGQNFFSSKNPTASNEKKMIQTIKPQQDLNTFKNAQKDGKKKNISIISSLPKFSLHILIFGIIGFLSIVSQPIINYFLIKNFISDGDFNIQMLSILSSVKSQFCGTIFFSYANVYVKQSIPTSLVYNKRFFDSRIPDVLTNNDKILKDLYMAESESSSKVRYNNNEYEDFFYQILKGDVCDVFDRNSQYIDSQKYNFNSTKCNNLQSEILKQGFLVSAKYFLDLFKELFEITSVEDYDQRQTLLVTWEDQYKIKKLSQFTDLMITIISVLSDFITTQGLQFLNFNMRLQITLAITQVVTLILAFYFGWMTFYNSTHKQMNDTVQLLSLIDINVLATNSYTSSYLNSRK
ncbi:transmembrane protein, putative (macronuclear) [Tetrahymena thermophila SB210]|uniref:Transmembrane protein, putative n=1 Tax=Tetrahymena thermophila (strain SB210) TaxID=312017 RepID=I7MCP5_TETTS|nr:transmembrane protein, putative [Tetrahymena thermophila SB210]EAR84485.1 transmembrane protein, putative [Tetrahymena thermophila SB210]|eukprot:XP_001032148.1 transmembrane protein, putative [Tetrahymena thermophila SB210]